MATALGKLDNQAATEPVTTVKKSRHGKVATASLNSRLNSRRPLALARARTKVHKEPCAVGMGRCEDGEDRRPLGVADEASWTIHYAA